MLNNIIAIIATSQLISVDGKTSVRSVLDYMISKSIRNIGIKEGLSGHHGDGVGGSEGSRKSKLLRVINDRKILEFLLSHNGGCLSIWVLGLHYL